MKNRRARIYWRGSASDIWILVAGGLLAGFCNGLLGAGGGVIIVLVLGRLLPKDSESARSVYSNALLVMLPLSVLTLFRYIQGGALSAQTMGKNAMWVLLGAMAGGILGGVALGRLGGRRLKKLFAALTFVSGLIMITR